MFSNTTLNCSCFIPTSWNYLKEHHIYFNRLALHVTANSITVGLTETNGPERVRKDTEGHTNSVVVERALILKTWKSEQIIRLFKFIRRKKKLLIFSPQKIWQIYFPSKAIAVLFIPLANVLFSYIVWKLLVCTFFFLPVKSESSTIWFEWKFWKLNEKIAL